MYVDTMTRNYAKSCRICLAEGSRDIFTSMTPGTGRCDISVSSVSRLLEKFRFVTMMQVCWIDSLSPGNVESAAERPPFPLRLIPANFSFVQISESDNLPTLICDSCIVELNVAYNFKRQAIDTSVYLQRHMIEMGRVIDDIDMSPPRFQSTVPAPVKETPLEVKEEMLEPQSQIPASTIASMATNSGSPTTSVASGSSRSMVLVNTNSFSTIGADSTSDKDFVESYLPPKKRGREFQVREKKQKKRIENFLTSEAILN